MKVKLTKKWRDNSEGAIVEVSDNRAGLLIRSGIAAEIEKEKPKVDKKPKVETAMAEPAVETAEVTPEITKKTRFGKSNK